MELNVTKIIHKTAFETATITYFKFNRINQYTINDKNENEKGHFDLILMRITQVKDVLTEVSELTFFLIPLDRYLYNGLISEGKKCKTMYLTEVELQNPGIHEKSNSSVIVFNSLF